MSEVCFDFQYGTSQKSDKQGSVAVLRMGNLQNGEVDYSDLVFTSDEADIEKYSLCQNELLFNRTNSQEWVGKTAIYRGNIPAIFAGYIIRVKPIVVNPYYLNYLMNSEHHRDMCLQVKTDGVNQSNINARKLSNFVYPLPPLAEQHRIVAAIESAFAAIDEIERRKTDLQAVVAVAKQKILSLAIQGKLVLQDPTDEPASVLLERIREGREQLVKAGKTKVPKSKKPAPASVDNSYYENLPFELPKTWEWYRLSEHWDLLSGRDLKPSDYSADAIGIPYITGASNFTNGELIINRWTNAPKVTAQNGDLLVTCKGTVGAMRINTQGDMHIARQIMAVRNRSGLSVGYLSVVMDSFVKQITSAAKGIIPGISREDLLNMMIPCPPLLEQQRIVIAVESASEWLDSIDGNLN